CVIAWPRQVSVKEPAAAETQARLGAARILESLYQTDAALEQLRAVIEDKPSRPLGALAGAYLALGEGEDRLGHRDAAMAAYRLAQSAAVKPDKADVRSRAADRMR